MTKIGVLHLIDTLEAGGAERVAVNLVNRLPRDRFRASLGTTRREGPLASLVLPDVARLRLRRRSRLDARELFRLVNYLRDQHISLLHAHSTTLLLAVLAAVFVRGRTIVWHDHFGRYADQERPVVPYRLLTRRAQGVIAVNRPLADWSQIRLHVPAERIWYVPNFVEEPPAVLTRPDLPGVAGQRIVCVANLRPQKDHLTLVKALAQVKQQAPDAHLLLAGALVDTMCVAAVRRAIEKLGLGDSVTLLGQRQDIPAILAASDISVLSSSSEGLPLALLEYGMAALPVVATDVGQCSEVLANGEAGILIRPGDSQALAEALSSLLSNSHLRRAYGDRLKQRVHEEYSAQAVVPKVVAVYDRLVDERSLWAIARS